MAQYASNAGRKQLSTENCESEKRHLHINKNWEKLPPVILRKENSE